MTTKLNAQLREFHAATNNLIQSCPAVPADDVVRLRARLIIEEAIEALQAMFQSDRAWQFTVELKELLELCDTLDVSVDMVDLADACGDIDYVVEGTRVSFGIDGEPIADDIHRANMAKQGGPVDEHGKVGKPPGWTPPDVEAELRLQGWTGERRQK